MPCFSSRYHDAAFGDETDQIWMARKEPRTNEAEKSIRLERLAKIHRDTGSRGMTKFGSGRLGGMKQPFAADKELRKSLRGILRC
jgi:hypothetical protein